MKSVRQGAILEIIEQHDVETQEELSGLLREAGFAVTQATVSRDINELKLIKVPGEKGGSKYARVNGRPSKSRLREFIAESKAVFDHAGNTVVIKCSSGTAQTLCMMIDSDHKSEGIVGTIAGEDTIFVLMRTEAAAEAFCKQFA